MLNLPDALSALIMILATWRVSSLLVQEGGPFAIFERLRARTTIGGVLECLWCTSVWAAIGVYALYLLFPPAVLVLAISAGAILFDRVATSS